MANGNYSLLNILYIFLLEVYHNNNTQHILDFQYLLVEWGKET